MPEKIPYMQFYTADWRADTCFLSLSARGFWMSCLCVMHDLDRVGELRGSVAEIGRATNSLPDEVKAAIEELKARKIADVTECHGIVTIRNRRMSRDYKQRINACKRKRNERSRNDVTLVSQTCPEDFELVSQTCPEEPPRAGDIKNARVRAPGRKGILDSCFKKESDREKDGTHTEEETGTHTGASLASVVVLYPTKPEEVLVEAERICYPMSRMDAENFIAKYASIGWMGRNNAPIRDWRRLLVLWKNNDRKGSGNGAGRDDRKRVAGEEDFAGLSTKI